MDYSKPTPIIGKDSARGTLVGAASAAKANRDNGRSVGTKYDVSMLRHLSGNTSVQGAFWRD